MTGAILDLLDRLVSKIAAETGIDKAKTYAIAIAVAREWTDEERRKITDARKAAKARIKG